jgi:hypothetical protein
MGSYLYPDFKEHKNEVHLLLNAVRLIKSESDDKKKINNNHVCNFGVNNIHTSKQKLCLSK